jgi:molecular chaperone GrpE
MEEEDTKIVEDDDNSENDEIVEDPSEIIADLEQKLEDEHQRLLRIAAELENVRKRCIRDVSNAVIRGRSDVLNSMLPTIDALNLAIKSGSDDDGPAKAVLDGVSMVRKQFLVSMEQFGLKPIETLGKAFDPVFHEAVAQIPSEDHDSGEIIDEMRAGFMLGDRLLRASMVMVSSGDPEESTEEEEPVETEENQTEESDG